MGYDDLVFYRDGIGHRLLVQFRDDGDRWVDFNAEFADKNPDYIRGLVPPRPTITIRTEQDPGIYVPIPSNLTMRNDPWDGNEYGFWDAPLPVTIKRKSSTYTFSSWAERRVKLSVELRSANGGLLRTDDIGVFKCKGVDTSSGDTASITLVSLWDAFTRRSAESVKNGSEWYKGMPIGWLIARLARAALPDIDIDSSLTGGVLDLGTLSSPRTSSWGPCPGVLTTGNKATFHWVPRALGSDRINAGAVLVGCEVPGSQNTSGGALASFNISTGRWTIIGTPDDAHGGSYFLQSAFPIFAWSNDANYITVALVNEKAATLYSGFYELRIVQIHRTNGTATMIGGPYTYWPARWCLREGASEGGGTIYAVGHVSNDPPNYHGESMAAPFTQRFDTLLSYIYSTAPNALGNRWWQTYYSSGLVDYDVGDDPYLSEMAYIGHWGAQAYGGAFPAIDTAALRHWLNYAWHGPVLMGDGTASGAKYLVWISTSSRNWRIKRIKISASPYTEEEWLLGNLYDVSTPGGHHLYHRQIVAYCANGNLSGGRELLVSTIEWNDGVSATAVYSRGCLWKVSFAGSVGSQATCTLLANYAVTGHAIVGMTALPFDANDYYHKTFRYVPCCVLSRNDLTGKPYRVGIWDAGSETWGIAFNATTVSVPSSSLPFAGFTLNHTDGRIYFIDQSTGQVWSVDPTSSGDFRLENGALPAHSKETHVGTVNGMMQTVSGNDYTFWGFAPGPHGDVTKPYWERAEARPSSARYVAGLYPLVQFSKKVADSIDVAQFTGLKVHRAIAMLRQIAYHYVLKLNPSGSLSIASRTGSTPVGDLRLPQTNGVVAIESDQIPVYSYTKRLLSDQVINAVDVTPHELRLNPAEQPVYVSGPGSQFAGSLDVDVSSTDRPLRIAITCISGGDMLQGSTDGTKHAILWRYERVLESIQTILSVPAASTDTSIVVTGFSIRGSAYYCGEQAVRAGDSVQVLDGTVRQIASLAVEGQTAVRIYCGSGNTIGVDAGAYAEVTITPSEAQSASDSDDGVTTLAAAYLGGATTMTVSDASMLRANMGIKVDSEDFLITSIGGNVLTLTGGKWGTTPTNHALGAKVLAFIATQEPNQFYEVGDTGIRMAVTIDTASIEDVPSRTIVPGDRVIITTHGYSLYPMEHAVSRTVDAASIRAHDDQRLDMQISDNRFLDTVKAEVLRGMIIADRSEDRIGLFGCQGPYWPGLSAGDTVTCGEKRIIPNGTSTDFECTGVIFDFEKWEIRHDHRAFEAVAGAGKKGADTTLGGYAIRGGARR